MQYGICNLSIIPLRIEPADTSEMVSQILYGEHFKVLEIRKNWTKVRLAFDKYEGWIDTKQYILIEEEDYKLLTNETSKLSSDLVDFVQDEHTQLYTISLGSTLNGLKLLNHSFEGYIIEEQKPKSQLISTAKWI